MIGAGKDRGEPMPHTLSLVRLAVAAAALAIAPSVQAADAAPAAPRPARDWTLVEEKALDIGGGFHVLSGAGGQTTVAVGRDGVVVVDAQVVQVSPQLTAKVAALSPLPVRYVINTHYHNDHTGGNAAFRQAGATLVAHESAVRRLTHPAPGATGVSVPPSSPDAVPNAPYAGAEGEVGMAGLTAELHHPAPAHTDTDTIVIFPEADVIATGGIVTMAGYPNFEVPVGGNINGMIAGTDFILAHAGPATRIVPAGGGVTDKAGVAAYREMLAAARDRIARAKASGMTQQQVIDANPLADLDGRWNAGAASPRFIGIVYQTVP
jgi:glyoxylase-like metal-dependent hydrolase (beta-lactamase superfamily II)